MDSVKRHIVHISTSDIKGGASLAAFRMHKLMLRSKLFVSEMAVLNKTSLDDTVSQVKNRRIFAVKALSKISRLRLLLRHGDSCGYLSSDNCGAHIKSLKLPRHDITHIHWVQGGFLSLSSLQAVTNTVIWTLHDMWPVLGLRHYGEGIGSPKILKDEKQAISNMVRCRPKRLVFHCTTKWMAERVKMSEWGEFAKVEVVPYPVANEYLHYRGQSTFRKELGIESDQIVILFGAIDAARDRRKGFDLAIKALTGLQSSKRSFRVILFGCTEIDRESREVTNMFSPICAGHIDSERKLADIYGAADIMLVPSRIEAFGQTAIEAQACGVPVLCFSGTGVSELIEDGVTGFVVPAFDTAEMSRRILQLSENPILLAKMKLAARDRARELWASDVVLKSMESLYQCAQEFD